MEHACTTLRSLATDKNARTSTFSIRVSEADVARLAALAAFYNIDRADVVRMLVKRDADAVGRRAKPLAKARGRSK
jgi:hypothetical protein